MVRYKTKKMDENALIQKIRKLLMRKEDLDIAVSI
jgi:hypothetical protein